MPKLRTLALGLLVLAAVGGGGAWWYQKQSEAARPQLRTAKVERGTLTATVAASCTPAAVVQVQVSSQVSGQLRVVLADFNAEVPNGPVLARLLPETFQVRVPPAEGRFGAAPPQAAGAPAPDARVVSSYGVVNSAGAARRYAPAEVIGG